MKQSPQFTGGYFLLTINVTYPPNNGAILNKSQIIDVAMPSAAEAELDELSINAWETICIWQILTEIEQSQSKTPIQTNTPQQWVKEPKNTTTMMSKVNVHAIWMAKR
jgi:hypothetical protein